MRSTIKTGIGSSVTVEPSPNGARLGLHGILSTVAVMDMTPDQAGALIFALEMAIEVHEVRQQRMKAVA